MIDVIADSGVLIDVVNRRNPASDAYRRLIDDGIVIGITDIVYAELHSGTLPRRVARTLDRLVDDGRVAGLHSLEDFERAAACRRTAARAGTPVRSLADCLIASVCIRDEIPLLHGDRDFDALADCTDLQVISLLRQ